MSSWERSVGATDEWYTPTYIFDGLGCTFDLDVAPSNEAQVPAHRLLDGDGLTVEWDGFVWMNPPYGGRNGLVPWLTKFLVHGNGIALVPDRTSAPWFQAAAKRSDLLLFLSPKVKFIAPGGTVGKSPSTGSVLLAVGQRGVQALRNAANLGFLATPSKLTE